MRAWPFCLALGLVLSLVTATAADVSKADLLGADDDAPVITPQAKVDASPKTESLLWHGFAQWELARAYREPEHWDKSRFVLDLSRQGQWGAELKWKIAGRFEYDPVYDRSANFNGDVRKDRRYNFTLKENYLDWSAADWDWRLGRQHIVWGEMVGLFFADVVSARDLREFYLPEFEVLRIPQWALRGEYFADDRHVELIWIPVPSYDRIGRPGGDFYPYVGPYRDQRYYLGEQKPANTLANTNYGVRFSQLSHGWDVSAFVYHGQDVAPTHFRVGDGPLFQPRHVPINQLGATLGKDLGVFVLKGEAVFSRGRKFTSLAPEVPEGVIAQDTLDYALGFDFAFENESRLNTQFFQRIYFSHDPRIGPDAKESGVALLLNGKPARNWEAQIMVLYGLNRGDSLIRPRLSWAMDKNWRWLLGMDIFNGREYGMFGQYSGQSRVYSEIRYLF